MKDFLIEEIEKVYEASELNTREDGGRYFDRPLIGFASADDSLFLEFKEAVGPFHQTPQELLEKKFGFFGWQGGTVISWILPTNEKVRVSNAEEADLPSRLWAHTRNFGERLNVELRQSIASFLLEAGHRALAPQLLEEWKELDIPGSGPASTWSERHVAYAAGLGTFSLSDGLITERGIAHRCGSVVTDLIIPPSPRPYASHTENCPFCTEGKCGVCIRRCPVGAITEKGHDKIKCRDYTYGTIPEEVGAQYGVSIAGCGLCQTKVPCESKIPGHRG